MKGKRVFVGLSGGVDSSVAALRLLRAGYDVTGVFIRVWHPDFIECNEEEERLDAMRVAAHLGIPFLTCDAREEYKRDVADYMIAEYEKGRTPNPDVMCNKAVKFGRFLSFAKERGADFVATGHYAQVETTREGTHVLRRGVDASKDQSYFLWTLTEEQLAHVLLPIGDTYKQEIRLEAERARLPTARKKDSQGICFLGAVDMKEFLSHYITTVVGHVVNEHGEVVGEHDGALFYTIGQRHGFRLATAETVAVPHYVTKKDISTNSITVSPKHPTALTQTFLLSSPVLRVPISSLIGTEITVSIRYHQKSLKANIESRDGGLYVTLLDASEIPSVGQSAVLYTHDVCVGGGIIEG